MGKDNQISFESTLPYLLRDRAGEETVVDTDEIKQAFWRRMRVGLYLTNQEAGRLVEISEIKKKFPGMSSEEYERMYEFLRRSERWMNWYPESKPRGWNEENSFIWIFPKQAGSTNKMAMKRVIFGEAELEFFPKEEIVSSLTERGLLKVADNLLLLSPVSVLSYPFGCDNYGNYRDPLEGRMHHISMVGISRRKYRGRGPGLYPYEKQFTNQSWSPESLLKLSVVDAEVSSSQVIAGIIEAINRLRPFEGGLPGQNS